VFWDDGRKRVVETTGEWIGDRNGHLQPRSVDLKCESSTEACLPPGSLDIVLTDPPYFANVQYAELMDFCYVWLRRIVGDEEPAFFRQSTRNARELTGNATLDRGLSDFTLGLSQAFQSMAHAMKPDAPLAFTYHHNSLDAYYPVAVAVLDAGLTCTKVIPCPAEMGASIHINGTGSSTVDSVFVCRLPHDSAPETARCDAGQVAEWVQKDLEQLRESGLVVAVGDTRCVIYGHLVQAAIESLRRDWQREASVEAKLASVAHAVASVRSLSTVEKCLVGAQSAAVEAQGGGQGCRPRQHTLLR